MSYPGYYSVIQYSPGNFELLNIGLLIYCGQLNYLRTQTLEDFSKIQAYVGDSFDEEFVRISLPKIIIQSNFKEHYDFLRKRVVGKIRYSELKYLRIEDADTDFDNLYQQLIL